MSEIESKINDIFNAQLLNRQSVRETTYHQRSAKLKLIETWLINHRKDIQRAMLADYSKPSSEVDLTEIWTCVTEIRHIRRQLKKWMRPKKVPPTLTMAATDAWIQNEPKGVVLIIAPWNFPFNLTIGPLVCAIASGNCAIVKPSELTPNSSNLMSKMASELFEEKEVSFIEGDGSVAESLLEKPFHHIFFTGSPKIGKIVMEKAAKHLSTVTLELGGKSPTIVDKTANIKDAAKKISWGKFLNCGQICLAPDYLLVHESVKEKLLLNLKTVSSKQFGGESGSSKESKDYSRIVNNKHYSRLNGLIKKSTLEGAQLFMGGDSDSESNYIAPTILTDIDNNSPIMSEEIFGPILPVITFKELKEATDFINKQPKPLGLYIFSKKSKNIDFILDNTSAGGTCINDTILHYMHLNLPFGGINNSGVGSYHGKFGFDAFSHQKAVLKSSSLSPFKIMLPPYNNTKETLANLIKKYF